jgi:hypothetical protein
MFRYYQTGEKSTWTPVTDSPEVEKVVKSLGATKLSVLAVSELIDRDDTSDKSHLKYRGPLYFDVDLKDDIPGAAKSARALVQKLEDLGVNRHDIQVFASGSKGFHIFIPQKVFSAGKPTQGLPDIYKEMALRLYVEGLDLLPYCKGRGNCFRIANLKREDKGTYRVPLAVEELEGMSAERYRELVAAPRDLAYDPPLVKAMALEAVYEACRKAARAKVSVTDPVPVKELQEKFKDEWPTCVHKVRDGAVREGAKFNTVGMALASFICRAGMAEDSADSLIRRAAETAKSSTYDTPAKRAEHLRGLVAYIRTNERYQFSCPLMRSVVSGNPCEGCALQGHSRKGTGAPVLEELKLVERNGAYYQEMENEDRRISTFVIRIVQRFKEQADLPGEMDTTGMECEVVTGEGQVYRRVIPETAWYSKSAFLQALRGLDGVTFFGADVDVQKIKCLVFAKAGEQEEEGWGVQEVVEVTAAGVHVDNTLGRPVLVYVEPGFSINQVLRRDGHVLNAALLAPPAIRNVALMERGDPGMDQVIAALMGINLPHVMGQLIGWFCAAHLKTHIVSGRSKEFPLLNMWGNAGSGKSKTAHLLMRLSGVDERGADFALNLPGATKYPILEFCSSTTTIPRLLEEFNASKFLGGNGKAMYTWIHELFKAAWDEQSVSRGAVGSANTGTSRRRVNAQSINIPITAPIVFLSEQAPDTPALRQRTVQVLLSKAGQRYGEESYFWLEDHRNRLMHLAKALVLAALGTGSGQVYRWMDGCPLMFPRSLEHRPRKAFQIVWAGLEFLGEVLIERQMSRSLDKLAEIMAETRTRLETEATGIAAQVARSEVDAVLDELANLAYFSQDREGSPESFVAGKHYLVDGDKLYIDLPVAHALYKRYARVANHQVVVDNTAQFLSLIQQETYFETANNVLPQVQHTRPMAALDLKKLAEKGVNVSLFEAG